MDRVDFVQGTTELRAPLLGDEPMGRSPALMRAADIERLLVQAISSRQRDRGGLALQGPLAVSAFSQVFRAEGGGIPRPVVVKQFVRDQLGASAAEAARRYFFALKKISEISRDAGVSASEPLLLLEHHGIVVASWIEGPTLTEWLFQNGGQERGKMLGRAGAWLGRLHCATGLEYRVPDIAEAIAEMETEFSESTGRTSRLMLDALAVLRSSGKDFESRPVPWSLSHGDFKPSNLIVDGDRLVGIDFDLAIQAPSVNDAAHFLNHLHSQFYTWRGLHRRFQTGQLVECFAQEYARAAGEELDASFLTWRRLYNAMHLVLSHRNWSHPAKAWLVDLTLKHQVKALERSMVRLRQRRPGHP